MNKIGEQIWEQFKYNAMMSYLEDLKNKAVKCGIVVNPATNDKDNYSMLENVDVLISIIFKAIEISDATINISINAQTSILIIPISLMPLISMSPKFKPTEDVEPFLGLCLLGTIYDVLSVAVSSNIEEDKIYVYDVVSDKVISVDLV